MAEERHLKCNKNFQVYVEKHNLYDVFQELLKEMIILKPHDPLAFIRSHATRVAKSIYNPRAFVVGPKIAEVIGQRISTSIGVKFITLDRIIEESSHNLEMFMNGIDKGNEESRKLLVSTIHKRITTADCEEKGFVLYGFPQNKAQAICAQKIGLLPRQIFIFYPDTRLQSEDYDEDEDEMEGESQIRTVQNERSIKYALSRTTLKNVSPDVHVLLLKDIGTAYHYDICKVISFDKLMRTSKADLDAELIGILMTGLKRIKIP